MPLNIKDALTFNDICLIPQYSTIKSRADVDLSVKLSKGLQFAQPIIPANMKSICGFYMALQAYMSHSMAILHRFSSWEEQMELCEKVAALEDGGDSNGESGFKYIGFSVGIKEEDKKCVDYFAKQGAKILCIDVAHCDSEMGVAMTKYIADTYPNVFLIAGAIATGEGAERLWRAGADAIRVGIGNGSICSTRIETGNGVPQLTALSDVWDTRLKLTDWRNSYPSIIIKPIFIIADGGCKVPGDLCKSLCFADLVLTGNMFSGSSSAPGNVIEIDGTKYKEYAGSSTHKTTHIEGVSSLVKCKGSYQEIITKMLDGITSCCSYQNAHSVKLLQDNPQFVRLTNAGWEESKPNVQGLRKD